MCNKIKCAGLYTVDLINNYISRDVQTGCTSEEPWRKSKEMYYYYFFIPCLFIFKQKIRAGHLIYLNQIKGTQSLWSLRKQIFPDVCCVDVNWSCMFSSLRYCFKWLKDDRAVLQALLIGSLPRYHVLT